MGLFSNAPIAVFAPFTLYKTDIKKSGGKDSGKHPLTGVTATVESGEDLYRRITATRILLTGVFALAIKKKKGGTSFLTIEGPGFAWVEEVDRKKRAKAMEFAAAVRAAASTAAEPNQSPRAEVAAAPAAAPAAPPPPAVPAGWYPAGEGLQRYWDGAQWTEHTAPLA